MFFKISMMVAAVVAAAALALAMRSSASGEYEFVFNGTFTTGIDGWTTYSSEEPAGSWDNGTARLQIFGDDQYGQLYQCMPVVPGVTYTQKLDVRVPALFNAENTRVDIHRLYSAWPNCGPVLANTYSDVVYGSVEGWQELTLTDTAPLGAVSMWTNVRIQKDDTEATGRAYFDNVSVTASTDSDGDGCSDGEEISSDPNYGGQRDPFYGWDFFDVTGDEAIDQADTLAVLSKFGLTPFDAGYESSYDRVIPDVSKPWRTALAPFDDKGIDLADALVSLQSFGHSCFDPAG